MKPTHCPHCGTKLTETTWGRLHCPNCGIVDGKEEINEDEIRRSYIQ